jgi:hypothetical protein
MVGSATGAGLDGAALAKATNSIVVVLQYRLGVVSDPIASAYTQLTGCSTLARTCPASVVKRKHQLGGSGRDYCSTVHEKGDPELWWRRQPDYCRGPELRCADDPR